MDHNVLEYIENNRDQLIKRLLPKVRSNLDDAEDVLADYTVNVLRWVRPDMEPEEIEGYVVKGLNNMLAKYYREKSKLTLLDDDTETSPLVMEQLFERQMDEARNPLDKLIEDDYLKKIPSAIEAFTDNEVHQQLLLLIYVEGIEASVTDEILGISAGNRRVVVNRFLDYLGESNEDLCR